MNKQKTVVVAMSGGVDSSVTAALLKEQGYNLIGVTMQIWPEEEKNPAAPGGCCNLSAVEDARRVAEKLDIPFYVMNFRPLFQTKVIDYFVQSYLAGKTPNPCIACNQEVKFAALLDKSRALGADYIATGHYARIAFDEHSQRFLMKKALDTHKDQTYVLYGFTQEQLAHTLLPLGDYTKPQIRQMARQMGLAVAEKPESQEICFVTDNDYRRFIKEKAAGKIIPGPMLDTTGRVIGRHQGIPFYTIGQRKGLGLALGHPAYVVAIDPVKNAVVIGDVADLTGHSLIASHNNYIFIDQLRQPMAVTVKIRYQSKEVPAMLVPLEDGLVRVDLQTPERAITPGQAVVYYAGENVVGGGIIEAAL